LSLARVLLVHDELAPRLALQTLLQAGGYEVDVAASGAEAVTKLDEREYELVLSDLQMESPHPSCKLLAYARMKDYRPATAVVTAFTGRRSRGSRKPQERVAVESRNITELLSKVADLIGLRASRRAERALRVGSA